MTKTILAILLPCSLLAAVWSTWNGKTVGTAAGNVSTWNTKAFDPIPGNLNSWNGLTISAAPALTVTVSSFGGYTGLNCRNLATAVTCAAPTPPVSGDLIVVETYHATSRTATTQTTDTASNTFNCGTASAVCDGQNAAPTNSGCLPTAGSTPSQVLCRTFTKMATSPASYSVTATCYLTGTVTTAYTVVHVYMVHVSSGTIPALAADQFAANDVTGSSATLTTVPSVTTTTANQFLISALSDDDSGLNTPASGFTKGECHNYSTSNAGGCEQYRTVTSTGTYSSGGTTVATWNNYRLDLSSYKIQ
jgi:hypothetical protein